MTTTVSRLAADREQMAATLRHTRRGRCCDASAAASEPEDAISVVEECCRRQPLVVADGWGASDVVRALVLAGRKAQSLGIESSGESRGPARPFFLVI